MEGVIANGLLSAKVAHARVRPKHHAFRYGVYYLCFGLDEIERLKSAKLLSHNRFNLLGFYERDHGARDGSSLDVWIRNILREYDIPQVNGRVVLLAMPRVLGYVFNPVSFWFCLDEQGGLRAVLSEVNNTFADRHCYLSFHDDRRVIAPDDILISQKIFHVSPFIEIKGHYQFRFQYSEDKIAVSVDHYDEGGLLINTSVSGKRLPLNSQNILQHFFGNPLLTLKVITLIHYHALRLSLKGIRYIIRPAPPEKEVSR